MNRIFFLLVTLFSLQLCNAKILCGCNYNTVQEQNAYPTKVRICNASEVGVVLRTRPDENSKLTGYWATHLKTGAVLECVGEEGRYYRIIYNGEAYYIPKAYASPYNNYSTNSSYPGYVVIRNADEMGVALRTQPDDSYKLTGSDNPHLFTGYKLECVGVSGSYYRVKYNGCCYYIPMEFASPCGSYVTKQSSPYSVIIRDADEVGVVLRTRPDEQYKLTGNGNPHFFSGDRLRCAGVSGAYYKVIYDGGYYYLPREYAVPYDD